MEVSEAQNVTLTAKKSQRGTYASSDHEHDHAQHHLAQHEHDRSPSDTYAGDHLHTQEERPLFL